MNEGGTIFMPPANSTIAGEVDALFYFIYYTALVMFAIVIAGSAFFILKYRHKGKKSFTSGMDHNFKLEVFWTVIPTILVFIVFAWGFKTYLKMNVAPRNAIEIKATGQKWFWSFDYPNGANSVNDLIVPANKPVKLLLSSRDVIHSFFVPDFRVKMDALPNRYTTLWFRAEQPGEHHLFCTEYCGTGHSAMLGKVKVVSEEEYNSWLNESGNIPGGMTPVEYGADLYQKRACVTCHSIDGRAGVAPSFKGRFGTVETLSNGESVTVDENYLRESILSPRAKVVAGYQPVMPTFQGILNDQQIDALIAYIKSLQ